MKPSILIAGILAATLTASAKDPKPADVTVYMNGNDSAPSSVAQTARATVTWMFSRIGVRVAWRVGEAGSAAAAASASQAIVQVNFVTEPPAGVPQNALARALPFGKEDVAITVIYDRLRWVAGQSNREAPILAHVLAHEIAHVLQLTNWHAPEGVMKARWDGQDYDAMGRTPLKFTKIDVELIQDGLKLRAARNAGQSLEASTASSQD